jgi:hypothetical protein
MIHQSPSRIMLVKPAVFEFNPETSETNVFQLRVDLTPLQTYQSAMKELENVYKMYTDNGVGVELFESRDCGTPDAIFPNCVSTFPGSVFGQAKPVAVLHPMSAKNRIAERSEELVTFFKNLGYDINDELLSFEARNMALEGTGSVVMDHVNKIAYCALSKRTHPDAAKAFGDMIKYKVEMFDTADEKGKPVYHTDLIMNINTGFSCVAMPVIAEKDRARILSSLIEAGRDVVKLDMREFKAFCGNSLEVRNNKGEMIFSTSTKSFKALLQPQIEMIQKHVAKIIHTKIRMVERVGGGSKRCLTQELHGLDAVSKSSNLFRT